MARLVTIGDSLTQGFQSGAIFRTDLSFPVLMARSMGLSIPTGFPIPSFPGSGLPLNIEEALRTMEKSLGQEIDPFEWVVRLPALFNQFADGVEDLYERGAGSRPVTFGGSYHNLAVWGFKVVDSFTVHSQYCDRAISREEGWLKDDFFGLPSGAMYRTAKRVLNPRFDQTRATWTQLTNLKSIVETEQSIDALVLWLGSNDCLGTVVDLQVKDMTDADVEKLEKSNQLNDPMTRRDWNLTNLNLFERDFAYLVDVIAATIPATTRVFVGTIPHVTIPPITQGLGSFDGKYFDYYGPFFATPENYGGNPPNKQHLTKQQVMAIDQRVDGFNGIIRRIVGRQSEQWSVVDIGNVLDTLAVKRNEYDDPGQALIDYYRQKGREDHPLLQLTPIPSVLRFETRNATRLQGGLFSLDSIHPTTIGYGIVAEEFLTALQGAGIAGADPLNLDWQTIILQDTLIQVPPALWDDILSAAEENAWLWELLLGFLT